jgi:hypothetical protein
VRRRYCGGSLVGAVGQDSHLGQAVGHQHDRDEERFALVTNVEGQGWIDGQPVADVANVALATEAALDDQGNEIPR